MQDDFKRYRHRAEAPFRLLAVLVVLAALVVPVWMMFAHQGTPAWVSAVLGTAFITPFVLMFGIHYNYWQAVVDAVEVTPRQYPELHQVFAEQVVAGRLGFQPRLYVTNGNGILNAFAAKGRWDRAKGAYVVVNSDIVDTFYVGGDREAVRFILSHELGHIRLRHVEIRYRLAAMILAPFMLGKSMTRAQEYSADRFAASITDGIAASSLAMLYAGKYGYRNVDLVEYAKNDLAVLNPFWVSWANFFSDHAVGRRRMAAAVRMDAEGWDVHGDML